MPEDRLFQHPGIQELRKAIRREQRWQLVACLALLVAGLSMCYFFFATHIILTIMGLFLAVLGLRYTVRAFRLLRPEDHPLMRLLRYQPHRIVWVYTVVTQRLPFGLQIQRSGTLYCKLIDGDEVSVSLPGRHLKLVSKTLSRLLPHASFGYSENRQQWYLASPALLLRKEEDQG